MDPVYVDYNATTPVLPEVFEAMRPWFVERFANPSSRHPGAALARRAIDEARVRVAALIGARPDEIVFTGSGTESSNLAIRGAFAAHGGTRLVCSAIEHPATVEPVRHLERAGALVEVLGVDRDGRIEVPDALPSDLAVLSVMHANNETGVVQPVRELAERAHRAGGVAHVDAAQSLGKIPVDVDALGADLLTVAGHKLYAPKGVGALYVRSGTPLQPLVRGAGHERGIRPGTENVAGIVGLGEACRLAEASVTALGARLEAQRDALWEGLRSRVPGIRRNGGGPILPNTLSVRFPGVSGNAVLDAAPHVAASTGSACHAHGEDPSAVILAMGVEPAEALGTVRLSLGRHTTDAEIRAVIAGLSDAWRAIAPTAGS